MSLTPARFILLTIFLFGQVSAHATPTTPSSDAQVLERLPFKPTDPVAREMANLRTQLRSDPKNLKVAVQLAQRYYDLVGEEGDPRYLGYAQAALAPWWELPAPPDEVQLLRASLRQFRHDFAGAIADLDALIVRNPKHPQARALRAVLHIVQARYSQGRADCSALGELSSELITTGCEAMVDGINGKSSSAYQELLAAFQDDPKASGANQIWVLMRLAEMAQRLGKTSAAQAHFKQALDLDIPNTLLLAAYADFLLDQQRMAEIITLLKDKTRSDTLLLRLVLAEHSLKHAQAQQNITVLANRYNAAQMRGDTVHQQEEARFALAIENNPKKSLKLAQENWKVQREPRDARVLLEAAVAAKDAAAAQPVLEWLAQSHHEDPIILNLARQLAPQKTVGSK